MNNSEFIEKLKASKFYPMITRNLDPILIYLCGSRIIGLSDEHSDYDIDIIVADGSYNGMESGLYGLRLCYQGKHVDCFYVELSEFKSAKGANIACPQYLTAIGAMQFRNFSDDLLIYKNPKYENEIAELITNKESIADNACIDFYTRHKKLVDKISDEGFSDVSTHRKLVYHLIYAYHSLKKDGFDVDFLRALKNFRKVPLSDEQYARAREEIIAFRDYMTENYPD